MRHATFSSACSSACSSASLQHQNSTERGRSRPTPVASTATLGSDTYARMCSVGMLWMALRTWRLLARVDGGVAGTCPTVQLPSESISDMNSGTRGTLSSSAVNLSKVSSSKMCARADSSGSRSGSPPAARVVARRASQSPLASRTTVQQGEENCCQQRPRSPDRAAYRTGLSRRRHGRCAWSRSHHD